MTLNQNPLSKNCQENQQQYHIVKVRYTIDGNRAFLSGKKRTITRYLQDSGNLGKKPFYFNDLTAASHALKAFRESKAFRRHKSLIKDIKLFDHKNEQRLAEFVGYTTPPEPIKPKRIRRSYKDNLILLLQYRESYRSRKFIYRYLTKTGKIELFPRWASGWNDSEIEEMKLVYKKLLAELKDPLLFRIIGPISYAEFQHDSPVKRYHQRIVRAKSDIFNFQPPKLNKKKVKL